MYGAAANGERAVIFVAIYRIAETADGVAMEGRKVTTVGTTRRR
jgi:hypothetical protein